MTLCRPGGRSRFRKSRLFLSGSVCIFIAAASGAAPAGAESQGISPGKGALLKWKHNCQVTLGYWNDNFIFEEVYGAKVQGNRDDFETASFWVQVADEHAGKWWFFDSNFSILTDKTGHYRTDVLAFRQSREFPVPSGTIQAGLGIAFNGDFGGCSIQNGYHEAFGYQKVNLPYSVKSRLGGIVLLRYKPVLLKLEHCRLGGYVSNYLRTAIIPSNSRAGLEFNAVQDLRDVIVHFQSIAGYTGYYGGTKPLSSLFENGFTWGILVSGGIKGSCGAAAWYSNNQYGLRKYQFGISLIFGWNGSRMSDLNEVTFP